MHWFWRATIAITIGSVFGGWYEAWNENRRIAISNWIWHCLTTLQFSLDTTHAVITSVIDYLPVIVFTMLMFGATTLAFKKKTPLGGETRCRKCGYILRGITEPRCPECGEKI